MSGDIKVEILSTTSFVAIKFNKLASSGLHTELTRLKSRKQRHSKISVKI